MTPRYLTHRDRALAEPLRQEIPDSHPDAFWRRVRAGFYLPVGLFEGESLRGLLVASVDEREDGRELWLQLATEPQWAAKHRDEILDIVHRLAADLRAGRLVFESKRQGWSAVARSLGFTRDPVVRYTKEVPHER